MKTTFGAEFTRAAREGPRLFFAPLVAALTAFFSAMRQIAAPKPSKPDAQSPCQGE
jgi:hypothetical protein